MGSQRPGVRVYAETSVFGGAFDDEFRRASLTFFEQVRAGQFQLMTSALVAEELRAAPTEVRTFFNDLEGVMDTVEVSAAALDLRAAYLEAGSSRRSGSPMPSTLPWPRPQHAP